MNRFLLTCCALIVGMLGLAPEDASSQATYYLKSPAYGQYNTFVNSTNFLELVAAGTQSTSVDIRVYTKDGVIQANRTVTLSPKEQVDVDINALVNKADTYGIVRITFDDSVQSKRVIARMSTYRPDSSGQTYSFVYSRDLREPVEGTTFAPSNSFDPQGRSYLTPNWAQVVNLEATAKDFTHNIYDQGGSMLSSETISLESFERRDVAAAHQFGEGVFINEFIPADSTADYLATVTRYGTNSSPTSVAPVYVFAMPVDSQVGLGTAQYMPILKTSGDCFEQTNWVEVVNVGTTSSTVNLLFRDHTGNGVLNTDLTLAPMSQYHFNAGSAFGSSSKIGSVKVTPASTDHIISQSAVYYDSCSGNRLLTAFSLPSVSPFDVPIVGSFNRFLEIENQLLLVSTSGLSQDLTIDLNVAGASLASVDQVLGNFDVVPLNLNDSTFVTEPDSYGTVAVDSNRNNATIGFNIRVRYNPDDPTEVDFAVPTILQ